MTDLASPTVSTTAATAARATVVRPSAVWRVVSLSSVLAAAFIVTMSVLGARDAGNVPAPERSTVPLEPATVMVNGLPAAAGSETAVLGLAHSTTRRAVDPNGTEVDLPRGVAVAIGLYAPDGSLVGLAVVPGDRDRTVIEVSPASTARALLALSPGILRPDLVETFANLDVIEEDPAFQVLVRAIAANSNLSLPNAPVEAAFAAIADRVPAPRPRSDQGCSSVFDPRAYASAGACIQPKATGLLIANEQDRWSLIFDGADGWNRLCTILAPAMQDQGEVMVSPPQCSGEALIVAPGPFPDEGSRQEAVQQRVRVAAAVNQLYSYAGPFAEIAGGAAGSGSDLSLHITTNAEQIVDALEELTERNDLFNDALDVSGTASTPVGRERAALVVARLLIEASDTTTLIPQRSAGDAQHVVLLDFYERATQQMVSTRTDWRWEAVGVGTIDFGGES